MKAKTIFTLLILLNALSSFCANDLNHLPEIGGNVIPDNEIEIYPSTNGYIIENQNTISNPNSDPDQILKAQLDLIIYHYWRVEPDYNLILNLCNDIIQNNEEINHRHAPFFLAELYFKGQGVQRNLNTALLFYRNVIESNRDIRHTFQGPWDYVTLSEVRIHQIESLNR